MVMRRISTVAAEAYNTMLFVYWLFSYIDLRSRNSCCIETLSVRVAGKLSESESESESESSEWLSSSLRFRCSAYASGRRVRFACPLGTLIVSGCTAAVASANFALTASGTLLSVAFFII